MDSNMFSCAIVATAVVGFSMNSDGCAAFSVGTFSPSKDEVALLPSSSDNFGNSNSVVSPRRRNYRERYRRIVQSEWFKEAYDGMSVDFIRVDE